MPLPTLEEIERAYAETGLEPAAETWASPTATGRCACALGAVFASRYGFDAALKLGDAETTFGVSAEDHLAVVFDVRPIEVAAFESGFDNGADRLLEYSSDRDAYLQGVAAREKFRPFDFDLDRDPES